MRRTLYPLLSLLFALPALAHAGERLIPAGSLVNCTIAEPKINSKTTAVGDPVLCQMGHSERYGRSVLPYNSYLVGRFEDYKDPGHLVGKGWMELVFDRMVIQPDTVIPVDAKVVDVPGYVVDKQGRILGKGHAVRDTITWMIPVLWPIDLINLPRRGPRPTLKQETRLTLKVMDDLAVPQFEPPQRDPYGLTQRPPNAYNEPAPAPTQEQAPDPQYAQAPEPPPMPAPDPQYAPTPEQAPQVMAYAPPPVVVAPTPIYFGFGGGFGGGYAYPAARGYYAPRAGGYYAAPRARPYGAYRGAAPYGGGRYAAPYGQGRFGGGGLGRSAARSFRR
jgi:hypothetical protein